MTILSQQKHTLTLTAPAVSVSTPLSGTPVIANSVPFITTRIATAAPFWDHFYCYQALADFDGSDVRVRTAPSAAVDANLGSREVVAEATVTEFDPAKVKVQTGEVLTTLGDNLVTTAIGDAVDLSRAFLYCTGYTDSPPWIGWERVLIRGRITGTNELTFDSGINSVRRIRWYVIEAIDQGGGVYSWAVDPVSITIALSTTSSTAAVGAVNPDKSFLVGSYLVPGGYSFNEDSTVDSTVDLALAESNPGVSGWDTVTATRLGTSATASVEWDGFVVEMLDGTTVQRDTITTTANSPDPLAGTAITTVDEPNSWVHVSGSNGSLGGGAHNDDDNSHDVPGAFVAMTFRDSSTIDCEKYINPISYETGGSVTWEVIEWEVGGAPPATPRRVMVIT